ncbi:MAG: bifunctional (p)ppGpp synthetase/guanosine-3',5'-bis(diphosphate) 3'-pyrophosphohydrolase [Deltaproteobacteria bacterium]|nr:bifunctional (p)ppGpp synthetase/guanosine-3',5'-bis(diphosphate) 3'-pyrophosphohydrolase [Deltaproteobacteria bacterium]
MVRLEDILERAGGYSSQESLEVIKKAYVFSAKVHEGQTRLSGEDYLTHPLEVADILTSLRMDVDSVATGLLHDTVEDTHTTVEKIHEVFGEDIAAMVDGLTKLSRVSFAKKEERQAENFRKMVLAMAKDIRVVIIKLADRLHNMRTLGALSPEKRRIIAEETLGIYAPLANRLGMGEIKMELEDLSFKYLQPEQFAWVEDKIKEKREEKEGYIARVQEVIENKLGEQAIGGEVSGRVKHLYSIYKKMIEREVDFDDIHDILAFRVVVSTISDCYSVLGIIHSTWKPVPGRFKDYIAIPRPNLYQSLHTTVIGPEGEMMEVQIRTEEMHRVAEFGIASHWKYKETTDIDEKTEMSFAWLNRLLEWQKDLKDPGEFLETLKVDLFPEDVFVFTPEGEVRAFPAGATVVDFAYGIHTDIGNHCAGAKVNRRLVSMRSKLKNGDVVEIVTSDARNPTQDWFDFVVTSHARNRIRHWLKVEEREKCTALGLEILDRELERRGLDFKVVVEREGIEEFLIKELSLGNIEALYLGVGYGRIPASKVAVLLDPASKVTEKPVETVSRFAQVFRKFKSANFKSAQKPRDKKGVIIKGVEDVMIHFAPCCNPLPGEDIIGFITSGKGVSIHTSRCRSLLSADPMRLLEVEWGSEQRVPRPIILKVLCQNTQGLLADMSNAIREADANITRAEVKSGEGSRAVCTFVVGVIDAKHLRRIIRSLEGVKKVLQVKRVDRAKRKQLED